jgi:elongation factor Ts
MYKATMNDIKSIRQRTGAGIKDCKTALTENEGDFDAAIDWLRTKGIAKAAKKAGRIATEGSILCCISNGSGAIVEVNCETDFVARTDDFKGFSKSLTEFIANNRPSDIDALMAMTWDGKPVVEHFQSMVVKTGENVQLRRFSCIESNGGYIGSYIHTGSRLGTLFAVDAESKALEEENVKVFCSELGLHLAARRPQFTSVDVIPEAVVTKEREIQVARAVEEGKPVHIAEKMVNGRLGKWKKQITLVDQIWMGDDDGKQTVSE